MKNDTNGFAYLIRQGQQVVVEQDGSGRKDIILAAIPRFELQNRRKLMFTLIEVLGVWKSKGQEATLMNRAENEGTHWS